MSNYKLPDSLRDKLKDPIGPIIQDANLPEFLTDEDIIVTIGDVTTEHVLNAGYRPRLAIVDGKTKRGEYFNPNLSKFAADPYTDVVVVSNPAAMITFELCEAIKEAATNRTSTIIHVDGEEDLALLPCMIIFR